jgi:glycosyltransferase involved in cell wall biosynthesis
VRQRYLREVEDRPYGVVSRRLHDRARLDVLWFPFNGCSWTKFSRPAVATLHDASNFVLADTMPQMQVLFRTAVERCRALVTDSLFSQRELARVLNVPLDALTPIPLGVETPRTPAAQTDVAALQPYVLFVGTSDRRKGLEVLCAAMARVRRDDPSLRLVIAGERSDKIAGFEGSGAQAIGYVDDGTLAALYRSAELFAFPSLYEGFGLPVLEAMSYGTPVVASRASAIPEAGGEAACYAAPGDAQSLAQAILRVRRDPSFAMELRQRGLARAAEYTWTKTAAATLDVLERAAQ